MAFILNNPQRATLTKPVLARLSNPPTRLKPKMVGPCSYGRDDPALLYGQLRTQVELWASNQGGVYVMFVVCHLYLFQSIVVPELPQETRVQVPPQPIPAGVPAGVCVHLDTPTHARVRFKAYAFSYHNCRPSFKNSNPKAYKGGMKRKREAAGAQASSTLNPNWAALQSKLFKHHASARGKEKESEDSENGSLKLSAQLLPRKADCSITTVLAIDCEMVGVGSDGRKNMLARVSLVNVHGTAVYDKYVKPVEFVTDFRTRITGVSMRDLRKGQEFSIVQKEVGELLNGHILVGHAVRHDLKVLLLSHPKKDIRDTSLYRPLRSDLGRPKSLRHLASEFLGVNIQDGVHCPVEDARAAMYLYLKFREEWEKSLIVTNRSYAGYKLVAKK